MIHKPLPPGPKSFSPLGQTRAVLKDPINLVLDCWQQYGDIVRLRLLTQTVILLHHPDYAKVVMQDHHKNYDKNLFVTQALKILLGNGLFTSDGSLWLRQRRLIQPIFQKKHLPELYPLITESAQNLLQQWPQTDSFDLSRETMTFIMKVIGRSIFSLDLHTQADIIENYMHKVTPALSSYASFPFPPLWVPTPRNQNVHREMAKLNKMIYGIIDQYRASSSPQTHDLLSLLLSTQDEQGQPMSDQQIRDELLTFLLGGHETTARTLAWTWYMISTHPEAEERLYNEIDETLGGKMPTIEDFTRLPYLNMVIQEILRLFPPAFVSARHAIEEDEIGRYRVPKDSMVLVATYTIHRHPDFWQNPDTFDPERFALGKEPKAYIPFGLGPRICIGRNFGTLTVATITVLIAQHYRLRCLSPHPGLAFKFSLRPRDPILVSLQKR